MDGRTGIIGGLFVLSLGSTMGCDSSDGSMTTKWVERSGSASIVAGMSLGDGESWVVTDTGELKGWGRRFCDASGCPEPFEIDPIELETPALAVHANGSNTAALMADGTVLGWGPTMADLLQPEAVDFGGSVVELGMGLDFLCARLDDDQVTCRSIEGTTAPSWLDDFAGLDGAAQLAVGGEHACARLLDEQVICWGSNDAGQLGAGATGSSTITLTSSAAQIEAGGEHTCARLDTGAVECWGSDSEGQLGHQGSGVGSVPLPESAIDLAAGAEHTCAIGTSGALYCWGSNALGQLGAGSDSPSGIRTVDLGDLRASEIQAGATAWTTFAVLSDGGLRGWGHDDVGQAGYGDRFDSEPGTTWIVGDLPDIPIFIPPENP